MRLKAKIDANHKEITEALRAVGCSVQSLATLGKGAPDLLCARSGYTFLIEVKSDKGKLTLDQETWHSKWKGTVHIVRNTDEAMEVVRIYSKLEQRAKKWGFE